MVPRTLPPEFARHGSKYTDYRFKKQKTLSESKSKALSDEEQDSLPIQIYN